MDSQKIEKNRSEKRSTRQKTKFPGVYQRFSEVRLYKGKPDVCFDIAYRHEGRLIWEKAGWLSEGYSAKLASNIKAERLRAIRHGQELPRQRPKVPLFKDLAERYLSWARENKCRGGQDDLSYYRIHLAPRLDHKRLNEISSFDLERMKSELLKGGKAPATTKHVLVLFRQMINKAIAWGLYKGENPVKKIKMPKLQNQRERFLNNEEAHLLLNELKKVSPQAHDMVLLSLNTGLRAGEIFNLRGGDLDFQNELITVRDPKNKETRRVYMTEPIKAMLLNRLPPDPAELNFPNTKGGKIVQISDTYNRVVARLGFNRGIADPRQKVCFHTLRHTFASWLAQEGVPILTISRLMGHKTLSLSERYSHLSPDHHRQAANILARVFERGMNENAIHVIDHNKK